MTTARWTARPASRFLKELKANLENFTLMLAM